MPRKWHRLSGEVFKFDNVFHLSLLVVFSANPIALKNDAIKPYLNRSANKIFQKIAESFKWRKTADRARVSPRFESGYITRTNQRQAHPRGLCASGAARVLVDTLFYNLAIYITRRLRKAHLR